MYGGFNGIRRRKERVGCDSLRRGTGKTIGLRDPFCALKLFPSGASTHGYMNVMLMLNKMKCVVMSFFYTSTDTYRDEKDILLGEKKDEDCCSKYAIDDIQRCRCGFTMVVVVLER